MKSYQLPLSNASVTYHPSFLSEAEAAHYMDRLVHKIAWEQRDVKVFGKTFPQPRLTALYGIGENSYRYAGMTLEPNPMIAELTALLERIQEFTGHSFNSVLLNLYRNGQDSNGWHSDDEASLGKNPVIASVSLGAERNFRFRERKNHSNTHSITLASGSLLVMAGPTQHYWHHQLPKTSKKVGKRINLTFRYLR